MVIAVCDSVPFSASPVALKSVPDIDLTSTDQFEIV